MPSFRRCLAAALLLASVCGACSSGATSAPHSASPSNVRSARPTLAATATPGNGALGGIVAAGGDLCGLLGPGDFSAVGVTGSGTPSKNSDGPTDAYCVYSGVSGASGGIEFDIFIGDSASMYQLILQNAGISSNDATRDLPGVDAAGTALSGPDGMAAIGVKKGQLAFDIDIPTSAGARAPLISLAKLVLQRQSGLSS